MRLAESERNVMRILWDNGETSAKEVAAQLIEKIGWSKTTTYTMLSRCVEKGYIKRTEPGFRCLALLPEETVATGETDHLIKSDFGGSAEKLVEALVKRQLITKEQLLALCESL